MGYDVTVLKDLNLVYTRFWGFVSAQDLERAMFSALENADYASGMVELTDLSNFEDTSVTHSTLSEQTERAAAYYEMQAKQTEHVVFAPNDFAYELVSEHYRRLRHWVKNLKVDVCKTETETLAAMGSDATTIAEFLNQASR